MSEEVDEATEMLIHDLSQHYVVEPMDEKQYSIKFPFAVEPLLKLTLPSTLSLLVFSPACLYRLALCRIQEPARFKVSR